MYIQISENVLLLVEKNTLGKVDHMGGKLKQNHRINYIIILDMYT